MISVDTLARELGCTLSDLEDIAEFEFNSPPDCTCFITPAFADELRAGWSKKTGVDYTETVQ